MQVIEKPRIGISSCLLGKAVRHDGSHRRNSFINDTLADHVEIASLCPELELGLGVPRDTIQLFKKDKTDEIRLVFSKQQDHELTREMETVAQTKLAEIGDLDGYILKKDSPSCGLGRVPVMNGKTGQREKNGIGVFARELKRLYPHLPVEDEGRLYDDGIRENFLERIYAHARWRSLSMADNRQKAFREYHKRYKLMLMAKNEVIYRELGRLVASANKDNLDEVMQTYYGKFMTAMASIPRRGHHVNVLQHVMGYLKRNIDSADKAELLDWMQNYKQCKVKRETPIVLLQHHLRRFPKQYISIQYYFSPYPRELATLDRAGR